MRTSMARRGHLRSVRMSAVVVAVLATLVAPPLPALADPATDSLSLSTSPVDVAQGESFNLTLVLDSQTETRGVQFSLAFDPEVVRCDNVLLGDYYNAWASGHGATVFPVGFPPTIDNVGGFVSNCGVMLIGGVGGPTGSGTVATATFTALAQGECQVLIASHGVADTAQIPGQVEVAVNHASVVVHPEGWTPQNPLPELNGIWGIGDIAYAAGLNGSILMHESGSWTTATSGTMATLHELWGSGADDVFAVGDGGVILHYDGSGWSSMASPVATGLHAVWGLSGTDVFAAGEAGVVLHYNGVAWATMTSTVATDLNGICGSSASNVYVVGNGGVILRYDGSQWSSMDSGTTATLNGAWMADDGAGYAVGDAGTIVRLKNGTWGAMVVPTSATLRDVSGGNASDLFAVGDDGTILRYGGIRWDTMDGGESYDLYDVHGSSGTEAFIVGHNCPILHRSANLLPPDWDLNGDHVCDLYDILLVAAHWNETGMSGWIPEDLDLNGVIDLYDILIVSEHWNDTW